MSKVNLDAIIPREDFEVVDFANSGKKKDTLSIEDIKSDSFFFTNLRKPDFQRETNEWDSEKIVELIQSFISGDLIPAIILWRSAGGYLFIIDGSHRLSALAAWVNNDYGDGERSRVFYDGIIPEEQLKIAEETRKRVTSRVGAYADYKSALQYPDKYPSIIVSNAKNLGALALQLQWVEGDASKAENSFFKINQQAAPINKTELTLLKDRHKPHSIAARAIIRSGKGHKYWSSFDKDTQEDIQKIAAEINGVLFHPRLEIPIRTLDLPIAGSLFAAQTLPLIVDIISIASPENSTVAEITGASTITILKRVLHLVNLINSKHPSSLGLHPAVYFYSQEGRHKNASFLAISDFILWLERTKRINDFIKVRSKFEEFILKNSYLIQQISHKYRVAQTSYPHVSNFFKLLIDLLKSENTETAVIKKIQSNAGFTWMSTQKPRASKKYKEGEKFDADAKSSIFFRETIGLLPKCQICHGLIHKNSVSFDHIIRKQDGGTGNSENGQLAHPYCNTGFKN